MLQAVTLQMPEPCHSAKVYNLPSRGADARKAATWPEALLKQTALVQGELALDGDDPFWRGEALVVEDARDQYERLVAPLDKRIADMADARREVLAGLAAGLERRFPANPNLAKFLREDDPAGYLTW